ncbi:MAG TPA: hypothetical protein VN886_12005 [Acidimicrobiales bacterium]|nr:hypothetical protein [Acidimicrobiales bacterium]
MAELLVRAGWGDHLVISDLLATGSGLRLATARNLPLSQLVADAHVAKAWPVLSELAESAGVPFLVDPTTPFVQSGAAPDDRWAQLPYANVDSLAPDEVDLDRLVEEVVEFQLEMGATAVIPPYFYAASPSDPWFTASLDAISRTAEFMSDNEIKLQMTPIFCARLMSFSTSASWQRGVDRFVRRVSNNGASSMAVCLSPAGDAGDGYGKVRRLFDTATRAKASGLTVVVWRQGVYGPGLVAAGLDGYECGMGIGELSNVAAQQSRRRQRDDEIGKQQRGGPRRIYIETLGRSVSRPVGLTLFGDMAMRPKVMCDDEGCCPTVAETLDKPRHHAVRARARLLDELMSQPSREWRLNHIARYAAAAVTTARHANSVLHKHGIKEQIKLSHLESIEQVARDLTAGGRAA